jgi:hypothetical protein
MVPEDVQSRADFVAYVAEIAIRARSEPSAIPNSTLAAFLDGLSGWVNDMDGYFLNRGEAPPTEASWQLFAQAVAAGLVYE